MSQTDTRRSRFAPPERPRPPGAQRPNTWPYWIGAACLYLAGAPWGQEPHLIGKLRWVAGGAVGMSAIDWVDLALHGLPIVGFAAWLIARRLRR